MTLWQANAATSNFNGTSGKVPQTSGHSIAKKTGYFLMSLVPSKLHENVPHTGGTSIATDAGY